MQKDINLSTHPGLGLLGPCFLGQRLAVYSAAFHVMDFIQKEGISLGGEGSRHFEGIASSGRI